MDIKSPACCNPWLLGPLWFGNTAQTEVLRGFTQHLQVTTAKAPTCPFISHGNKCELAYSYYRTISLFFNHLKHNKKSRPYPHIEGVYGE